MSLRTKMFRRYLLHAAVCIALGWGSTTPASAQTPKAPPAASKKAAGRPKLVVLLVVDQFRADYVEKFRGQWSGGLKRLVEEGAWFRNVAYPYAATETCVGHATISTGAFPATHGIVSNAWWDRESRKMVTCTTDPSAKNTGYAGISVKGGDSAWRMTVPALADEMRFQGGAGTRVVTFSLKARSAIALAGHRANAVTWFDTGAGAWVTSSVYGTAPFVEEYAKAHPAKDDFGKTWTPSLPAAAYFYDEKAFGAVPPDGWGPALPHALRGKEGSTVADEYFYEQWGSSPFLDAYLGHFAEAAVDTLGLGQRGGTDFLGIGFSALDYTGHEYGPRSHEVQDMLVRLDQTLGALFTHLDKKVGRRNYVVAISSDHGVAPIPEDMQKTGADAGWLFTTDLRTRLEKAIEPFNYPKPNVAAVTGGEIYFAPGIYDRLKQDPAAMRAVMDAIRGMPGVAEVYRAEEVTDRPATMSPARRAIAAGYFAGRSGDIFFVPKPYWSFAFWSSSQPKDVGATHGSLHFYDQRVPILLMGAGIRPGEYWTPATPADIAPTLAALCGITLATRDSHVLSDALKSATPARPQQRATAPAAEANP